MLSLHKLEIFARVIATGSFSAAADDLFMSQPAVSKHIQDLESSLGTRLFERAGAKGVIATESGRELYEYTCRILKLVAEAENKITRVENIASGQITIGVTQGVGSYLFPQWLGDFGHSYPNLTVLLQTGITPIVVEDVLGGKLQLGFIEGEIDRVDDVRLSSIILEDIEMVVVVGHKRAWWQQEYIAPEQLSGQAYIARQNHSRTRSWMDAFFVRNQIRPRIIAEFDSTESIKTSVMSGIGITILPDYSVQREVSAGLLHTVRLQDIPLKRELKMVWNNQTPFSPITRAFLKTLSFRYDVFQHLL